jgi:hypothetical protein
MINEITLVKHNSLCIAHECKRYIINEFVSVDVSGPTYFTDAHGTHKGVQCAVHVTTQLMRYPVEPLTFPFSTLVGKFGSADRATAVRRAADALRGIGAAFDAGAAFEALVADFELRAACEG